MTNSGSEGDSKSNVSQKSSSTTSLKAGQIRLSVTSGSSSKVPDASPSSTKVSSGHGLPKIRLSSTSKPSSTSEKKGTSSTKSSTSPSIKLSASSHKKISISKADSSQKSTPTITASGASSSPSSKKTGTTSVTVNNTSKTNKPSTVRLNFTPPPNNQNTPKNASSSSVNQSDSGNDNDDTSKTSNLSAKKKIKFANNKKPEKMNKSSSYQTRIWHQRSDLSFKYFKSKYYDNTVKDTVRNVHNIENIDSTSNENTRHIWGYEGTTTMYITYEDNDKNRKHGTDPGLLHEPERIELGLHLRGGCVVTKIQAFAIEFIEDDNQDNDSTIVNKMKKVNDMKTNPKSQRIEPQINSKSKDDPKSKEKKELPDQILSSNQNMKSNTEKKDDLSTKIKNNDNSAPITRSVSPDHKIQADEDNPKTIVPDSNPSSTPNSQNDVPKVKLKSLQVSYNHYDPLAKVFYTSSKWMKKDFENLNKQTRRNNNKHNDNTIEVKPQLKYEGDAYCHHGAKRMIRSLRVASAASALGELRLIISNIKKTTKNDEIIDTKNSIDLAEACWKKDLSGDEKDLNYCDKNGYTLNVLRQRAFNDGISYMRKRKRIDYISKQLAFHSISKSDQLKAKKKQDSNKNKNDSSSKHTTANAYKIVIHFHLPDPSLLKSSSGIHFVTPSLPNLSTGTCAPYVYTTCGTFGDHQGPRCWLPCLDTSSSKHRCSHELSIKVTAKREEGISIVGCGEDFGQIDTVIRSHSSLNSAHLFGSSHDKFLQDFKDYHTNNEPHTLVATSILYTSVFTPIPARSLGFAIGPFLVCPDPEYQNDIRQIYIAPSFLRSQLHSSQPVSTHKALNNAVIAGTSGVPLRALSLTREILGLPSFRSKTYTQIWLPACIDGGSSSGSWHQCQSVAFNSWIGGATLDSNLLPPLKHRLPFHAGGRVLQMAQARSAIMGWIISSLPLGGEDDVGQGYVHALFCAQLMDIYERTHGGSGEGGGKSSHFYVERFAVSSGLNGCGYLDFLPVKNVEEEEMMGGLGSGLAVEEKKNEELWRGALNGTESRTSAMDEVSVRKVLNYDILEYLERCDDSVPLPSPDWQGSHLSLTFLSSNSCSSSCVGSGATDLLHPVGGLTFRTLKCEALSQAISSRAGLENFIRFMRSCFIATMLIDAGETNLVLPELQSSSKKGNVTSKPLDSNSATNKEEKKASEEEIRPRYRPPFVLCVDDIILKGGVTHSLVTTCLRRLAGPIREPYLHGHSHWSLIDISTDVKDPKNRPLVEPEGFPNSYIRGSSSLYLRVGAHVEPAGGEGGQAGAQSSTTIVKGIHLHVYVEPVIPKGGISFAGPVTLRIVENEGQCCEYERKLTGDGRREEWGPIFLHAKTVTTAKQQNAASGGLDGASKDGGKRKGCYNKNLLHGGGFQALELIRLTNRTPLLWIRVDPHNQYPGARIHIAQPDACLAEQLFHEGDATGQMDALRALSERPTRIQGSVKISNIYDVRVNEMPVRILGDCLRGSVALHCSLPHTPAVRAQAALAIAQWQNNKAPASKDAVGVDAWLGLEILLQYFNERHLKNGLVMPVRYTRRSIKTIPVKQERNDNNTGSASDNYQYLDLYDENDRAEILEEAEDVAEEEDEEYRVRSAVITAIASIRAKDGQTPPRVLRFLKSILVSGDGASLENITTVKEGLMLPSKKRMRMFENDDEEESDDEEEIALDQQILDLPYVSNQVIADALLALCYVNCRPAVIMDSSGVAVQVNTTHPIMPLMEACHRWVEWELYKESIRLESERENLTPIGGNCYSITAACGITALSQLAILRNCTTNSIAPMEPQYPKEDMEDDEMLMKTSSTMHKRKTSTSHSDLASSAKFYVEIFDEKPKRSDTIRAAAAQAVVCICCATDRLKKKKSETYGLLSALEFLLDRILDTTISPGLRQTLSSIMIDVCSGHICSMPRVAAVGGRNDLVPSVCRQVCGPLGAGYGGDNGSALLITATEITYPAAHAVNHGALEGLRMIKNCGKEGYVYSEKAVIRVAKFATKVWRTMNGEMGIDPVYNSKKNENGLMYVEPTGICAFDGHLRVSLLSFWQKIWPKECYAILQVQGWRDKRGMVVNDVLKIDRNELEDIRADEKDLEDLNRVVESEVGRQKWRGEMATKAYNYWSKDGKRGLKDLSGAASQGLGYPLPPVEKDKAWKMGGWSASSAQQRRKMALDGGTAINRIRAKMKNAGD